MMYFVLNHANVRADQRVCPKAGDHTSTKLSASGVRKYDAGSGRFLSVDPLWEKYLSWTPYQYSMNDPINKFDVDGEAVDIIADAAFIAYDLFDIGRSIYKGEGVSNTQIRALGADIIGAMVPFATGGGMAVRAAAKVDNAIDAAKQLSKSNDVWKLTSEGSSEIKNHKQWGTFYKSKSDGLWWSVDKTGHGKSKYKVFKENKKGLEWYHDADEYGNFIEGKHKSATGTVIPWGQMKTVK